MHPVDTVCAQGCVRGVASFAPALVFGGIGRLEAGGAVGLEAGAADAAGGGAERSDDLSRRWGERELADIEAVVRYRVPLAGWRASTSSERLSKHRTSRA